MTPFSDAKLNFTLNPPLPTRLSELLRRALDDLSELEKDGAYKIDMNTWHRPSHGYCSVCLAGAVLARGGMPPNESVDSCQLDPVLRQQLLALNALRRGYVQNAVSALLANDPLTVQNFRVAEYDDDRVTWRIEMEYVVTYLRDIGL